MLSTLKRNLWLNLKNIPGWRTQRKILVIEGDDYGSIRMPSIAVREKLLEQGLIKENSIFDKYDTVETLKDMEHFFQVLRSFKDKNGEFAKFTPFFNPANPDFNKIQDGQFNSYHYRTYEQLIKDYKISDEIHALWKEGVAGQFFKPQYHGREHVNVPIFLRLLQEQDPKTSNAFKESFCHPLLSNYSNSKSLRAAFYFDNQDDLNYLNKSLTDGVKLFRNYFNYSPAVFCPSNGIFHPQLRKSLIENDIYTIVESGVRYIPSEKGNLKPSRKWFFSQKNKEGLLRYSRNVVFEPTANGYKDTLQKAFEETEAAFRWGKPAVIATHRVNFSGGLYPENREYGLGTLEEFLKKVTKKWPDIEFMSSEELSCLIHNQH